MFANRFTALMDACALVGVHQTEFVAFSGGGRVLPDKMVGPHLDEAERNIAKLIATRGLPDAENRAAHARADVERASGDATVTGYEGLMDGLKGLPDPDDAHVIAAAVKTRASVIVTDNVRHFPESVLVPLDPEAKTTDAFVADAVDSDAGRAVAAIRRMGMRLRRPETTAEVLLLDMEAVGLTQTVDVLRERTLSL